MPCCGSLLPAVRRSGRTRRCLRRSRRCRRSSRGCRDRARRHRDAARHQRGWRVGAVGHRVGRVAARADLPAPRRPRHHDAARMSRPTPAARGGLPAHDRWWCREPGVRRRRSGSQRDQHSAAVARNVSGRIDATVCRLRARRERSVARPVARTGGAIRSGAVGCPAHAHVGGVAPVHDRQDADHRPGRGAAGVLHGGGTRRAGV